MNADEHGSQTKPISVHPPGARPHAFGAPASTVPVPIRLIVNADDFGMSESVNAAVLEAYDRGILTSCSLMAGEPAAADAGRAARARPGLAVGLHPTTVCGHAL